LFSVFLGAWIIPLGEIYGLVELLVGHLIIGTLALAVSYAYGCGYRGVCN